MKLKSGEVNTLEKDSIIYNLGDTVNTIGFITEGTVLKSNITNSEEIKSGSFIGVQSLYEGTYNANFSAATDVSIRAIDARSPGTLADFLSENSHLHERFFLHLCRLISQLYEMHNKLYTQAIIIYKFQQTLYEKLEVMSLDQDFSFNKNLSGVTLIKHSFSEQPFYKDYLIFEKYNEIPEKAYMDMRSGKAKLFDSQSQLIRRIYNSYDSLISYVNSLIDELVGDNETSFLKNLSRYVSYLYKNSNEKTSAISLMKNLKDTIKTIEFSLKRKCSINIAVDYFNINSCIKKAEKTKDTIKIPTKVPKSEGSLKTILDYSEISNDEKVEFEELLMTFGRLKDKHSRSDENRKLYKKLTEKYYTLYEKVFLKYVDENSSNKIIDLFLNFGFLDEKLLTKKEIEFLFKTEDIKDSFPCKIYRIKDWLIEVYKGNEFASKNEFDEDYIDYVRHEKKLQGFSKEREETLLNDPVLRVRFEIQNMLQYNNKLLSGNILSFVPFLHSETFESTMEKMYLIPNSINSTILSIREIDYSVFYREFMYADIEARIEKEIIQKEVFPIIVLFPIAGSNGIMWQETTRRKSNSPGRFFMPSFLSSNLEETILKILGSFRWELCKQLYGAAWNNIQTPSLTSKYMDYIQFYRKDRELSPERKEALKAQISRCRNKTNEVFISDYITWVKHESSGAIRLNSVARRILATYCPFSKEIRNNLIKQPLFEKAMLKYNTDKDKKIKEINNRIIALKRKNATITQELIDTQKFYRDL